ncbi:hypothetical protein JRY29_01440 [Salmonella enterica subsp. enterica serovar Kentucky]|nr:hypothetical protein JRY29_01440 [Salmonella enterica subsp. enterica serovar Kentucky]
MSITSERERVIAPRFNLVTMITPGYDRFSVCSATLTLTPQQRAFIDAFADEVSQNNIRLFIGVIVLLTLSYYTAATVC